MKIECFADEKENMINRMSDDEDGMCPFTCGCGFCSKGEEGCKVCLETRIEWTILKEDEKALEQARNHRKPCPFCGGRPSLSIRQGKFFGFNGCGDKKIKMVLQVICNRCHSRGRPITSDWLINPEFKTIPDEYFVKAWEAWDRREGEKK